MKNFNFNSHTEQGFTLIELMISITLGLLVIAIASQIYLTSYSTSAVQKSSSELTEGSIFGIQQIESHIRLANLGNDITNINDKTANGGIILSRANAKTIDKSKVTSGGGFTDRLTIQFKNITGKDIYNCEGKRIANGKSVIESYFLHDGNLNCTANNKASGNGQPVIKGVDAFGVRLGVQNSKGTAYMTTAKYKSLKKGSKPAITSIKMGLLLRGSQAVTGAVRENFQLLGQDIQVGRTKGIQGNYVRNVYESNTYLRNARFD